MAGYKPITSTFLFKNLGGSNLTGRINEAVSKGRKLTQHDLLEQFVHIQNYERSLLKQRVLTEVKEGRIEIIYAEGAQLSQLMPFILVPAQIGYKAVLFLNPFCNMRQDGLINIQGSLLYTLLESAYLAKNFVENYNSIKNDTLVRQQGALMFANIFVRPLNKQYNLHADRTREGKVMFLASKYYLKNVLGIDNDEYIFNVSSRIADTVSPYTLKELDMLVEDEAYQDISTFIQALANDKLNLGLVNLQVRSYLNAYISMYKEASTLCLESMVYFIFMVNTVRRGGNNIFNSLQLEPIVEKSGEKMLRNLYR